MVDKSGFKCVLCGNDVATFRYKPMAEWNINGELCGQCYSNKLAEHYVAPDRRNVTKK